MALCWPLLDFSPVCCVQTVGLQRIHHDDTSSHVAAREKPASGRLLLLLLLLHLLPSPLLLACSDLRTTVSHEVRITRAHHTETSTSTSTKTCTQVHGGINKLLLVLLACPSVRPPTIQTAIMPNSGLLASDGGDGGGGASLKSSQLCLLPVQQEAVKYFASLFASAPTNCRPRRPGRRRRRPRWRREFLLLYRLA